MRLRALAVLALAAFAATFVLSATPATAATATTLYVSHSSVGNDTSCASPGFNSIQSAVTAASAGNVIKICAGTYPEQVLVQKALTLKGAGAGSTTVTYPASPAAASGTCADSSSIGLDAYPIVQICGGVKVKVSGLTIAGPFPQSLGCGAQPQGVFVGGGSTLNISHSNVVSIRQSDSGLYGCQGGVGLLIGRSALSQVGHAAVSTLTVSDYQKGGVVVDGTGSSLKMSSSTVTGPGSPSALASAIAMNGIQVSRGARGTISNVTVTGNECDAGPCGADPETDAQSVGVLFFDPGSSTVKGSVVSANDIGVYNEEDSGSAKGVVTSNTLSDNRYEGIVLDAGTMTAKYNRVSGGNIGLGVIVYSGQGPNNPSGTFTSGTITGTSTAAIEVDTDGSTATSPHLTATLNDLSGNTGAGVVNNTSTPINVTSNWWGDPSGPSDWSIGSGASVSANADFFPWATDAALSTFRACDVTGTNVTDDNSTSNASVLCGTSGSDFIQETGPNPVLILGNGGNDQLIGGSGDDSIIGGPGNDFINGNAGTDHAQGRGGTDTCLNTEVNNGC